MKLNQSGFTLIELLVVVAILGILTTMAVPSFKEYQLKARQSEAKVSLSSIYTAEQAYFIENTSYSGDLKVVGYRSAHSNYASGFISDPCVNIAGYTAAVTVPCIMPDTAQYPNARQKIVEATAVAGVDVFVAAAEGNISTGDRWSMDQDKSLIHMCGVADTNTAECAGWAL